MPTPCESWPRRFASTRLVATSPASSSDEPPAATIARMAPISVGAETSSEASDMIEDEVADRLSSRRGARFEDEVMRQFVAQFRSIGIDRQGPADRRSEHQQRAKVVDVCEGRPRCEQVAERLEERIGV